MMSAYAATLLWQVTQAQVKQQATQMLLTVQKQRCSTLSASNCCARGRLLLLVVVGFGMQVDLLQQSKQAEVQRKGMRGPAIWPPQAVRQPGCRLHECHQPLLTPAAPTHTRTYAFHTSFG
jgi:hypothetical protein